LATKNTKRYITQRDISYNTTRCDERLHGKGQDLPFNEAKVCQNLLTSVTHCKLTGQFRRRAYAYYPRQGWAKSTL
jgi:hypothetical protein